MFAGQAAKCVRVNAEPVNPPVTIPPFINCLQQQRGGDGEKHHVQTMHPLSSKILRINLKGEKLHALPVEGMVGDTPASNSLTAFVVTYSEGFPVLSTKADEL